MAAAPIVRITFPLEPEAWHGSATERLWAEVVGPGEFRLLNTPFFAFGISFQDVVSCEEKGGQHLFSHVLRRSGHSTYRIKTLPGVPKERVARLWEPLQQLGCTYEEGQVLAVDVPPSADIHRTYELLDAGLKEGIWDFEEGYCGHPV